MTPTIRPARSSDADILLHLSEIASGGFVKHLFGQVTPPEQTTDQYIRSRMSSPESGLSYDKMWVFLIDGRVAGFIALDQVAQVPDPIDPGTPPMFRPLLELEHEAPGTCLINLVATLPEYRGCGAGSALLKFAETRRGPNGICLTVADTNTEAQRIYTHFGYGVTGQRPMVKGDWESPGTHWLLMVKP